MQTSSGDGATPRLRHRSRTRLEQRGRKKWLWLTGILALFGGVGAAAVYLLTWALISD